MEKDKKAEAEEKIEQKPEEASENQDNEQQDKAADLDPPASTSEVPQGEEQSLLGEDASLGEELLTEEPAPVTEPFVGFSEGPDGTVRNPEGKVAYAPPGSHNAAMAGVQQDASGHVDSIGTDNSSRSGTRV